MSRGQNDRRYEFDPLDIFITVGVIAVIALCVVGIIVTSVGAR